MIPEHKNIYDPSELAMVHASSPPSHHASSPPSHPSSLSLSFSLSLSVSVAEMAAAKLVVLPCWVPPLPAAFPARWKLECGRRRVRKGSVVSQVGVGDALYSVAEGSGVGYSPLSYYTSLGLFVISVPGLWSLIKRSVKSKVVQKTFVKEGQKPSQVAGEILSFFTRNNFTASDRGETISFEGMMVPSRGQAALLTFCTCISLGSVALVLSIAVPQGGNNWFWIMVLSPLAGIYYWQRASRKEEIKVKIMVGEDGSLSEIIVRGDDQQVEQMRKDLQLSEKGMIYVKGIFET